MSHIAPEPLPEFEELTRLRSLLHHGARPHLTVLSPLTLAARFGGAGKGSTHPCSPGGFPGDSIPNPRARTLAMGSYGRT